MKKRGPFQVVDSKQVYKNPWIEVVEDKVIRPDGNEGIIGTIRMGGGMSILPFDKEGNVYLKKEYGYAIDSEEIATASGGRDEGEDFELAAKRELQEELGITAKKWVGLGMVHPLTFILYSPAHLFLAMDLSFGKQDSSEMIEVVKVPFVQAVQWALDSTIHHAPSVALILRANEYLKNHTE